LEMSHLAKTKTNFTGFQTANNRHYYDKLVFKLL